MEANTVFNKFQKMGSKLGDNSNSLPNGVLLAGHKARAHHSQGFCSEKLKWETTMPQSLGSLKDENSKFENLFKRGCICHMDGASMVHVEQPEYERLKSCNSLQGASMHDSHIMYDSGLVCDGQCYTRGKKGILQASLARSTAVPVNSRFAVDFRLTQQVGHALPLEIPQKPPVPFGWLSLGVCGNALIMRVGSDSRCFHQQGLVCGRVGYHEQIRALDMLYAPASTQGYDRLITGLSGSTKEVMGREPVTMLQATTTTTKKPVKHRGKSKQKKYGKTTTLTRDLFERSSFHLCEVIFCYPLMSSNLVASNFQRLSRESLRELAGVINQVAVGLAGVGVALMLFVSSRMLSINAAFDKHKMVSLAMGIGILSMSLAMNRVAEVVKCMADAYSRARAPRKEHLIRLQKELQGIALHVFPLVAVCLIRFG